MIFLETVKTGLRRVDSLAVRFIIQRQNQTGNGQRATTALSEAEQRRKQYQAGVEGTGTEFRVQSSEFRVQSQSSEFRVHEFRVQSSEFRVQSLTQGKRSECQPGQNKTSQWVSVCVLLYVSE